MKHDGIEMITKILKSIISRCHLLSLYCLYTWINEIYFVCLKKKQKKIEARMVLKRVYAKY